MKDRLSGFRPSPTEWLCLLGGLLLTYRYRWLLDDAFIYFRYADNLLFLDVGLVYNQGEYVEGFSSPAWLLFLLPLRALHLDYWYAAQAVGLAAFVVFWALVVRVNRELSPPGAILDLPLLYLASSYAVLCYFTSGMETPLVQVAAAAYALYVVRPGRVLAVLLALSPLIRPELAAPLLLVCLWHRVRHGILPWGLIATAVASNGAWLCFRIYYYADLFPNTFYLKSVPDPAQGMVYLRETLSTYHFYPTAAAVLAALVWMAWRAPAERRALRLPERGAMLVLAFVVAAYVVSIGGDPRHYRYLAFPFCLAACSFGGVPELLWQRLSAAARENSRSWSAQAMLALSRRKRRFRRLGMEVLVGVILFGVFFSAYPDQLDRHPVTLQEQQKRRRKISDASYHRHMKRLRHAKWSSRAGIENMLAYRSHRPDFVYGKVSSGFWCVDLYERFDERVVHSLGLTDAVLGRTEMKAERPGHKWGLEPLARDLVYAHQASGVEGRGMFRDLVERGRAPEWIARNLEALEIIERKVYNTHDLSENVRLALTFPPKIVP